LRSSLLSCGAVIDTKPAGVKIARHDLSQFEHTLTKLSSSLSKVLMVLPLLSHCLHVGQHESQLPPCIHALFIFDSANSFTHFQKAQRFHLFIGRSPVEFAALSSCASTPNIRGQQAAPERVVTDK
jgi:hypothetical protein